MPSVSPIKNLVAVKAIGKLKEDVSRQEPDEGPVFDLKFARLNSPIRLTVLSACELWNKRSHYTNEQMPVSDLEAISSKHTHRGNNHQSSHFKVEKP